MGVWERPATSDQRKGVELLADRALDDMLVRWQRRRRIGGDVGATLGTPPRFRIKSAARGLLNPMKMLPIAP